MTAICVVIGVPAGRGLVALKEHTGIGIRPEYHIPRILKRELVPLALRGTFSHSLFQLSVEPLQSFLRLFELSNIDINP